MIITMYPEALTFVLGEGRDIFPEVPILALCAAPGMEVPKGKRRVIQHVLAYDLTRTLESALKLVPGAKRVYVVGGVYSLDKKVEYQARRDFKRYEGRLEFRYLSDLSVEEMMTTVSSAPPGTIIIFTAVNVDITGKTYNPRDVAHRLSQVSEAPIFGLYETLLGQGIAGGYLVSYERIGTQAGQLALNILGITQGQQDTSATLEVPSVPMFDWRELKRWNLNVEALPEGSIVVNKELTLWDLRFYIIGVLAFCLMETALVVILIVQRRRRRAAEEALRASEKQLRLVADSLPVLIAYVDREQRYQFNNLAYSRWFELSGAAVKGASIREVLGDKAYEAVRSYIDRALAGEEVQFETKLTTRDGASRYVEALYVPHVDERGGVLGFYALVHDVTEHRRVDLEIQRQREQLAHVARVSTLGELTASLAHEIHQPLTAIMSNAQAALRFLAQDAPDLAEVRDILADIVQDDRRASEVIQRLRLFLRRAEPELISLNLGDLVRDVVTLVRREALFRGISIETDLDGSLPPVIGDRVQLQQVVLNLFLNASEAMAQLESDSRTVIIRAERDDEGHVRVAVRDFGTGLGEETLGRLFEPFCTTKPDGLGMGLAICRSIIEAHGGRLWGTNNPDRGATFVFTLPVDQGGRA